MKVVMVILLLLGAQFSLTVFAPAEAGKAWLLWPFSGDSRPVLNGVGSLSTGSGVLTPTLAGLAGLGFLVALLCVLGILVPQTWLIPAVVVAVVASVLLHILYAGPLALLPIVVDAALLWLLFVQQWRLPEV